MSEVPKGNVRRHSSTLIMTAAIFVAAMLIAGSAVVSMQRQALAEHVEPSLLLGNQNCGDVFPDANEFRLDPPATGTFGDGTFEVDVTVRNTAQGQVFDFASNFPNIAVVVKGGPNANLYDYSPSGALSDTGLHAPLNTSNNQFFGLSHISFCWVPASASIEIDPPQDTNEVNDSHIFTVTVNKVLGETTSPADDGTMVDVTLTHSEGGDITIIDDNCANPGTVDGQCTVEFTSSSPGVVTGHASADVDVGGLIISVETDGVAPNSGDAIKRFVDAFITINPPQDTNSINEEHTFTVNVQQDDGSGAGFVDVPDGTIVTVTLTPSGGATITDVVDLCANPGTVNGECTVSFTSTTAGTVTGHASVTLTIEGEEVTRETDGQGNNSGDAVKDFIAGQLSWLKHDNAGNLLGGATFNVTRTHDFDSDTMTFVDIDPDVWFTVQDNIAPDEDADDGEFLVTGLQLGRYEIQEIAAPAGFEVDPDTETVELSITSPSGTVSEAFVNNRPIVKVTEFGYTNEPTGTPTSGVVSGTTTYTATLENFGGAATDVDISLTASILGGLLGSGTFEYVGSTGPAGVSEPAAGTDCVAGCTAEWTGISLAPGATVTVQVSVEYDSVPDGTQIEADLLSDYTLNGLTRDASGSPANITFTVQAD